MKEEKRDNVLNILSDLVNISSYGKIGRDHPIMEYLRKRFSECSELVELEDKNGNIHLLVGVNCELKDINNSILLSGHIDTVSASEGHSSEMMFDGENFKGLGTSDMKSFIASMIANIDYFKSLSIPVILSITSDEETQLLGINKIINELKARNIKPGLTIIGEPSNLDYYVSSRGNSVYVGIMNGLAVHSGTPELGINAIERIAEFVMEIKKISEVYSKESSVCITSIKGGKVPSNVVPDECSTCFGIRTSDSKVLDTIYTYLENKFHEISKDYGDSKLFSVVAIPPFERRNNEFINNQADLSKKKLVDASYATEAGYFQKEYPDSSILIYGPGNPIGIHKAGEAISLNNLLQYQIELIELLDSYLEYNKQDKRSVNRLLSKPSEG